MEQKLSKESIIHAAFAYLKETSDLSPVNHAQIGKSTFCSSTGIVLVFHE